MIRETHFDGFFVHPMEVLIEIQKFTKKPIEKFLLKQQKLRGNRFCARNRPLKW